MKSFKDVMNKVVAFRCSYFLLGTVLTMVLVRALGVQSPTFLVILPILVGAVLGRLGSGSGDRQCADAAARVTEPVELEERVRQTQKLESLGQLVGGVAHDFNNILAVIGANIGLVQETCTGPDLAELVDEVQSAVTRAAALTHQLFAFSRKQLTEPIVLDPNSAIVRHGVVHAEVALLDKPYSVNRLAGKVLQVLDAA